MKVASIHRTGLIRHSAEVLIRSASQLVEAIKPIADEFDSLERARDEAKCEPEWVVALLDEDGDIVWRRVRVG